MSTRSKADIRLPFPPSQNTAWRRVNNRTLLSKKARSYRDLARLAIVLAGSPKFGTARVRVTVELQAPTRRKYDLDNRLKQLADALELAGVLADDEQIDEWRVIRGPVTPPGAAILTIEALS